VPKAETAKKQKKRRGTVRVLRIIDGRMRNPFKKSDKKGFDAEDEVLKQGKYFQKKKIIKTAKLSDRYSPDDKIGRDLIIELFTGKIIYVQITAAYHREDELKARKQGVFYLPVYPWEDSQITKEKLLMIIFYGYLSDLDMGQMRKILNNVNKLKKAPEKLTLSERFRQLF